MPKACNFIKKELLYKSILQVFYVQVQNTDFEEHLSMADSNGKKPSRLCNSFFINLFCV